jgi:hypothetical protein
MVHLKSFLFGIGDAGIAVVPLITVAFILPLYVPYWSRASGGQVGSPRRTSVAVLFCSLPSSGSFIAFAWSYRLRA